MPFLLHRHRHSYCYYYYVLHVIVNKRKPFELMVERKQSQLRSIPTHRASSSSSKSSEAWHEMERINVQGIKDNIVKQVGVEKSKRYFSHFRKFLSSGLSKTELDKLVIVLM